MKPSILFVIMLLLTLTACGAEASAEPAPPTIHFGEDICEFCGMIISEDRFATAYVTADGHGHAFDDIGDMVQSHLKMQEDVTAFFVHDHESRDWIRGETAYYVLSGNLPTPMLSGLAAFSSAEKAKTFAAEMGGQVLTFDELLTHYRENPPTPFSMG
jgi:copper chaperone NosL